MSGVLVNKGNVSTLREEDPQADFQELQQPELLDQSVSANKPLTAEVTITPTENTGVLLITATHNRSSSEFPTASALLSFSGSHGVFNELRSNSDESGFNVRDAVMEILDLGIKQFRLLGVENISLQHCPEHLFSVAQAMGFREVPFTSLMEFGKGKS